MPFVKSEIVIKGEKQKIFDVIQDMASYPKFMKNLISVEVLEKGENYDISHWVSNVDGRKIVWTERDDFYPEIFKITYKQTAGDLKKMEGAWELLDTEEGAALFAREGCDGLISIGGGSSIDTAKAIKGPAKWMVQSILCSVKMRSSAARSRTSAS